MLPTLPWNDIVKLWFFCLSTPQPQCRAGSFHAQESWIGCQELSYVPSGAPEMPVASSFHRRWQPSLSSIAELSQWRHSSKGKRPHVSALSGLTWAGPASRLSTHSVPIRLCPGFLRIEPFTSRGPGDNPKQASNNTRPDCLSFPNKHNVNIMLMIK